MSDQAVYLKYFQDINPLKGRVKQAITVAAVWPTFCTKHKKLAKYIVVLNRALNVGPSEDMANQPTPDPIVNLIFEDVGIYLQEASFKAGYESFHRWHDVIQNQVDDISFVHNQGLHEMLKEFDIQPILDLLTEMETALSIVTDGLLEAVETGEYISFYNELDEEWGE